MYDFLKTSNPVPKIQPLIWYSVVARCYWSRFWNLGLLSKFKWKFYSALNFNLWKNKKRWIGWVDFSNRMIRTSKNFTKYCKSKILFLVTLNWKCTCFSWFRWEFDVYIYNLDHYILFLFWSAFSSTRTVLLKLVYYNPYDFKFKMIQLYPKSAFMCSH